MNAQKFTVEGRLPGLNEYTGACRTHWANGSKMKKQATERVCWAAMEAGLNRIERPVEIAIMWVEGRARNGKVRDVDNVRFGAKFVLDGLVQAGILPDDSPRYVRRIYDNFRFNANDPHVDVLIQPYVDAPRRILYEPVRGLDQWR